MGILPSPQPVTCSGLVPGAHCGEVGKLKNTLASSIMLAKRAELKKTNLVKEKRCWPMWGLFELSLDGVGGYRESPTNPRLFFLPLSMTWPLRLEGGWGTDPWAWGGKDPCQEKEHRNAPPLSRPLRSHDPSQARILPACFKARKNLIR